MKLSLREMRVRQAIDMATSDVCDKFKDREMDELVPMIRQMIAAGIIAARRADTGINPEVADASRD